MNFSPLLLVNESCAETLQWTKKQLKAAGLDPLQTFDLQTACAGLHDCSCSNYEIEECDRQLVVLLVYAGIQEPVTLMLHGSNGQTHLSIAEGSQQRFDSGLRNAIQRALEVKLQL